MIGVSERAPAGVTPSEQGGRAGREQALGGLIECTLSLWVPNSSSMAVTSSFTLRWMSGMIVDHRGATAVSELPAAAGMAWPSGLRSRSKNQ